MDWLDAAGKRVSQPEYLPDRRREREWTESTDVLTAPAGAVAARLELQIYNAPRGTVWWDDITVTAAGPAPDRRIRVGTVYLKPRGNPGPRENVAQFLGIVEQMATERPDIVCLPEGITVVGLRGQKYLDVAESVPGPTTEQLGETAKRLGTWIVAGIYERDGNAVYNTSVLVDRLGAYAGKYRKVYLPREEVEGGLTPGDTFPVFDTDFGRIGMMICWDVHYPNPAGRLARQGAELILMPIWGGNRHLVFARAIENATFLVSSCYSDNSFIVDPKGAMLGEASAERPWAVAEIDLEREYRSEWLGDMKTRGVKEYRSDAQ